MYDLHHICEKADAWAKLFETPEYTESVATHSTCGEVDRIVDLLIVLDYHGHAAALMDQHIVADSCRDRHPNADQVTGALATL
ncbi:hypothetical protein [Rhodococcus sp. OK302]|uniref:hypothetical protein n=1 Tax=Rhodococcus sp. OK302 TaxID=1882769 RepID=UPI000B94403A|nr:hypothetical protein [Rhodococcus sp. OK302]OYD61254.1 hypothetical protein BDB13_6220 [Rhodococcus sp. OK302]